MADSLNLNLPTGLVAEMISGGPVAGGNTCHDNDVVLLQPTVSKKKNKRRIRNNKKETVICFANNMQRNIPEGVYLAESETDSELYDDYFENNIEDDFDYSNWKKGCSFHRSVSKNTKPKIRPHKRVKAVDDNRTKTKTENITENATAQKYNIQKRLNKMKIERIGMDNYFKRLETALKESVKSAKKSHPNYRLRREITNTIDHPNALKYELKHTNTSKDDNQTKKLADLQHREIGPEDYELLLLLDESIAPKTVSTSFLTSLRVVVVEEANLLGELCAICIEAYQQSDKAKQLPCKHYFHNSCIDNWLSNASLNCPLDGISVEN